MKKRKMGNGRRAYKKYITLLGIAGIFLSLIGCGKEKGIEERNNSSEAAGLSGVQNQQQAGTVEIPEAEGNYYTGEYVSIPETDVIELPAVSDTAVYYRKSDQSDDWEEKLMKYDLKSGRITELADAVPEVNSVYQLCVSSEGHPLMVTIGIDAAGTDESVHYWLREIDEDGSQIMEKELTGLLEEEEEETFLQYLKAGKDGQIYLAGATTVWVLDREGNEEFRLQTGGWIQGMGILPEGKLSVFVVNGGSASVKVLDYEKKEWGDIYTNDRFKNTLTFTEPGESGIYFYDAEGIYSYDPENGETMAVADWLYNDVYEDEIVYLSVREDGLHLITCDRDIGVSEMAVLKQTEPKAMGEKQLLTLGTIKLTNGLRGCVTKFNRKSDQYRIEIIEYAEGGSYDTGVQRFNNEIIAGNIPDIINITDGTEEFYAAKGIFEDLKPYLDGEEGIDRADYFDNVLSAMETDGKLYFFSPDFYIDTIAGKKEVVGEGYNWTLEDMKKLEETREEGTRLFSDETKQGMLDIYLRYNMAQFFDLNKGFCGFDNEAFKEVLEFANRFSDVSSVGNGEADLENEELLLMQYKLMGISGYQKCHAFFDADISFVGYPGSFACGSVAKGSAVTIAMNAGSKQKEGAWAFIRSFLEEDYQNKYVDFFPLLCSAFDRMAEEAMSFVVWTDENGDKLKVGERGSIVLSVDNGGGIVSTVELHPAKKEEVEAVRGLIEAIDRMERFDETVLSIISEESGAYFSGQKSVDEVVSIIQSRANIYMNENR